MNTGIVADAKKTLEEQNTGNKTIETPKRKAHPIYGEWVKVKVFPTNGADKNLDIFISVNTFGRQFAPGTEVELPVKIVKILKEAYDLEHYFDANKVSEQSGKKGVHTTREAKKYMVETVE